MFRNLQKRERILLPCTLRQPTHLDRTLVLIKEQGVLAGVALNPATPIGVLEHVLPFVDMVLVMTVNPGFGGQALIPYTLDKVQELNKMIVRRGLKTDIEVDGGITLANVSEVLSAGANIIVAGSSGYLPEDRRKM